ncbi:MAG: alpha/beta fold hydrolase [Deltaproteobacteria bacterium]|nr:alpha/beta fold hydrolase [Deltaproteobacteria bacterium]
MTAQAATATAGLVEVNGARLWVEDSGGDGPPIVFSHGLLWSGAMYAPQIAALRDRYRCISFDFRGQGKSPAANSGYDMDTLSTDAIALLEKLKLPPVHFVGLSMGGFIGMRVAARRPELVRSLSLLETAADAEPFWNRPRYRAMLAVERLFGMRPLVGAVMKIMFGKAFLTDPARAAERAALRERLLGNDMTGMRRAILGVITRRPIAPELGKIRTPTLVLSGAGDVAVVSARSRQMADAIAGAKFVVVPRAGHTSTLEEPALVTAELDKFLASVA